MKSVVIQVPNNGVSCTYPCMMITDDDMIVLFNGPRKGVVVSQGNSTTHIGYYETRWSMEYFTPWMGVLELHG